MGCKGVVNVFTVVLSAPRTGYQQRHITREGGREIQLIASTRRATSLTIDGCSAVVKLSKGCRSKRFVYSDSSSRSVIDLSVIFQATTLYREKFFSQDQTQPVQTVRVIPLSQ